jgi:hypothetical protein
MAEDGTQTGGSQSGSTETGDGTQSGTGTTQTGGTTDPGTQSGTGSGETGTDDSARQELDRQRERTRAADKRAADLEAELKQLRDKDLPEQEKLKRDHEEALKRMEALERELQESRVANAFLSDNEFDWHNPQRALKSVDLSSVDIDKGGNVTGLKEALRKLAKDEPYLVKPKDSEGKTETKDTTPPMNGQTGTQKPNAGAMVQRFPAMRSRGGRS